VLRSLRINNGEDLIKTPYHLTNVIPVPTINSNNAKVYSQSQYLRILGTGLIGAKYADLYFDPPLFKEIAYNITTIFPCTSNELLLSLNKGYEWKNIPGPLIIRGIDTGGGRRLVNGQEGVQIAVIVDKEQLSGNQTDPIDMEEEFDEDSFFRPGSETMHLFFFFLPTMICTLVMLCRYICSVVCGLKDANSKSMNYPSRVGRSTALNV
jgi:hypothetical protein